jgi:hypothetical protein
MAVPCYEPRNVEIRFTHSSPYDPKVFVDGPRSPHRYGDGSLCMWYPRDPPEQKWVFEDGLLALLNHIQAHLIREARYREAPEEGWPGPEAPHGDGKDEEVTASRDRPDHPRRNVH